MEKIILSIFLILILFPISSGFSAEYTDTKPTLSVVLTSDSPFVYKDDQGYTVVVGEVENTNKLTSVANVRIHVIFFDDVNPQPLDVVESGSLMKVIPPLGKSPYMIKSSSPNLDITQASVSLVGFNPAPSKSNNISLEISNISLDHTLDFSGVLKNGAAPISNTTAYLVFYDNFIPPRIIGVSQVAIGDVKSNEITSFSYNDKIPTRSVGFKLFAESNVFYSNPIDVKIPESSTKLVTISNVSVLDSEGNPLSEIKVGSPVKIQSESWIQFSADQKSNDTPYTYYVQIKQSGKLPFVEFIGQYDGSHIGVDKQFPFVDWTPENSGLFFIETFIWDKNNIPIADQGPIVLVIVN